MIRCVLDKGDLTPTNQQGAETKSVQIFLPGFADSDTNPMNSLDTHQFSINFGLSQLNVSLKKRMHSYHICF